MTGDIELFRPMLSASLPCMKRKDHIPTQDEIIRDLNGLDWSVGFDVSPKIDGIRAVKHPDMGLVSRSLTPIPNRFIQQCLDDELYNYLDGELITGRLADMVSFNDNQSGIMSQGGEPTFSYCIFDSVEVPTNAFWWRNNQAAELVNRIAPSGRGEGDKFELVHLPQLRVSTVEQLLEAEEEIVNDGYEGVIIRDPRGAYKNNRSTYRQQGMLKIKRFVDGEAIIEGFEELLRNTNEATVSKLGYTKRSSHKANKLAGGTLGKLLVRAINGPYEGCRFAVGSGLDDNLRNTIWNDQESYLGRIIKYKFQLAGSKDNPRTPIFLGFRDVRDMS